MRDDIVYGIHVVTSLLNTSPEQILEIYALDNRNDKRIVDIKERAQQQGITVHPLSKKQLENWKIENSQGVVARVRPKPSLTESDLFQLLESGRRPPLLLALDQVQDPHNLGACLRTADATGVDAIIIPRARSATINATVRKTASGATETVPCIEVPNLVRCLEALKKRGIWIIGTARGAKQSLYEVDLKIPSVFVLGGEGEGLRRLTAECCDLLIEIPMRGQVESLNVSVAAAVCLYEALRQREAKR